MPQPAADRRDVHSRFDTGRREEMSEIVVGEVWKAESPTGGFKTFLSALDSDNRVFRFCMTFGFEPFKKLSQCAGHGNQTITRFRFCAVNPNHV